MKKIANKISYLTGLIQKHGCMGLVMKFIEKKTEKTDGYYREHFQEFLADEEELKRQRGNWKSFAYCPKISIVVPAYRTPEKFLIELIESVIGQSYENWELCIADGSCDNGKSVRKLVEQYAFGDQRIRYQELEHNGGISENTNAGFLMASGDYIALLDHDDLLEKNALYEMVAEINRREERPLFLYSDEDKVDETGRIHYEPHFKTEYNEELLNHYNYICHFVLFAKELLTVTGGLNSTFDGAQDYDFVLRCSENLKNQQIAHVAKIVYHWRVHHLSTAGFSGNKDYAYDAAVRAVQAHLKRVMEKASSGSAEVRIEAQAAKGREFIQVQRMYESDDVKALLEDWIVCLSPGIKPVNEDWAERLVLDAYGQMNPVGMIGGKLLSSNCMGGKVCSVGYHFGKDGKVVANFSGLPSKWKGYFRKAVVAQNVSACSLDFCVIRKDLLEQTGGLDEELQKPYQDLDFAFRLREAGFSVILDAQVAAYQKKTTAERKPVFTENNKTRQVLLNRWGSYIGKGDPFYNENIRSHGDL